MGYKCGKCGSPRHNVRTCGKVPPGPTVESVRMGIKNSENAAKPSNTTEKLYAAQMEKLYAAYGGKEEYKRSSKDNMKLECPKCHGPIFATTTPDDSVQIECENPSCGSEWDYNSQLECPKCHGPIFATTTPDDSVQIECDNPGCGTTWNPSGDLSS